MMSKFKPKYRWRDRAKRLRRLEHKLNIENSILFGARLDYNGMADYERRTGMNSILRYETPFGTLNLKIPYPPNQDRSPDGKDAL